MKGEGYVAFGPTVKKGGDCLLISKFGCRGLWGLNSRRMRRVRVYRMKCSRGELGMNVVNRKRNKKTNKSLLDRVSHPSRTKEEYTEWE